MDPAAARFATTQAPPAGARWPLGLAAILAATTLAGGAATSQAKTYILSPNDESEILVRTDRSGLLSFAGHRHVIRAEDFAGKIEMSPDGRPAYVELSIVAASLRVIDDDLDSSKVVQVQEAMETSVLEVEHFPRITFESIEIERLDDNDRYKIQGTLTLHGVSRQLELRATISQEGNGPKLVAEVEVKQKDYDIDRVSGGMGAVKVKEEVKLSFTLLGVEQLATDGDGTAPDRPHVEYQDD